MVLGKEIKEWKEEFPIIKKMCNLEDVFWLNENLLSTEEVLKKSVISFDEIVDASERLERFSSYIEKVFPETKISKGIIESSLVKIDKMKNLLDVEGEVYLKCDSHLPISGSIKARGGIYEVLKFAEDVAIKSGKLKITDNYEILDSEDFRKIFSQYSIAVGSTGNLGLSIGIMGAKLGFKVTVHMSADARQWKKDMLRSKGVNVIEYKEDYSKAVEEGRKQASLDKNCHFIDDENSKTLFLGYTVAALRLKKQLEEKNIVVTKENSLFVYLPCGVGGGPGGVMFGLKSIFGDSVHCFFAEPTHSPCMTLGLATKLHDKVCVQDFGIDNKTAADGLAVGRASSFVGRCVENIVSGSYTLSDEQMYIYLAQMADLENIYLEPSALAGVKGIELIEKDKVGESYLKAHNIKKENIIHIAWATGGNMVPRDIMNEYVNKGKELLK